MKKNNWWKFFWGTIIGLLLFYITLNITASKKLSEMSKEEKANEIEYLVKTFKQKFPEFSKLQQNLTAQSIKAIKDYIDEEVDKAYEPIYQQIDNFTNFHFSVTGEYTELFTIVFGDVNNILQKQIFEPAKFNKNLNKAFQNINTETLAILKEQLSKMQNEVRDKMNLNDDEVNYLFKNILKFTQTDMLERFYNIKNNIFRGFGLGSGAVAGSIVAKMISKNIAKVIAKKIVTKLAIKFGAKLASAGAGAAAGAESGLLCGPGAWLCSPVGAVVGGVIGWFASDKIIIEIDKYYNADDFKKDLKNLIDKSKQQTKQTLYKIYTKSLEELSNQNKQKFKNIKTVKIKDLIN